VSKQEETGSLKPWKLRNFWRNHIW